MKRKLLEENLAFLASTHVWEGGRIEGHWHPRPSFHLQVTQMFYIRDKYLGHKVQVLQRPSVCPHWLQLLRHQFPSSPFQLQHPVSPQIWKSNPASALKVFKSPSWIRLAVSNEAVRCLSLIVIFRIHMKVWYLIKSLPIWNHWGNETKKSFQKCVQTDLRCKARRALDRDLIFAWPMPLIHCNPFCKSFIVHQCAYWWRENSIYFLSQSCLESY